MAYKTFANGFPLPASDLNNFLMNQSVIVFADSAARTSAIPSPVEGMLTYLEDTNAYESWNGSAFVNINDNTDAIPKSTVTTAQDLIVADGASSVTRLGVGTDDQVLSVVGGAVAWADAAGGGGLEWTSIFSSSLPTGAASSTVTGLSGYDNYLIKVSGLSSNGFPVFFVYANGDTTASVAYINVENDGSGSSASTGARADIARTSSGTASVDGYIKITGASGTSPAQISWNCGSSSTSSNDRFYVGGGVLEKDSLALTSISFGVSAVSIDAGTAEIWGA